MFNKTVLGIIQKWNTYENEINKIDNEITLLRNKKNTIHEYQTGMENTILNYIHQQKLMKTRLNMGTHHIFVKNCSTLPPLNKQTIEEVLTIVLKNKIKVDIILKSIQNYRENRRKTTYGLKRKINKVKS